MKEFLEEYARAWSVMQMIGVTGDEAILALMSLRGYRSKAMYDQLKAEGVVYFPKGQIPTNMLEQYSMDLGIFVEGEKRNYFLMDGRFVLPIRDISGNVIALVGWYPDDKKYLTTKSKFFSKSHMFYGMENMGARLEGPTFMVEGIFDRLALESLGYRTMATMGLNASSEKQPLYKLMGNRIIGIPDGDKGGIKARNEDEWNLPLGASYLSWKGKMDVGLDYPIIIKDVDDLVKYGDEDSIRSLMSSAVQSVHTRRITARL